MRYDVKIVFVQEFSLAVEADTAMDAQAQGTDIMNDGRTKTPDKTDMRVTVEKGVV